VYYRSVEGLIGPLGLEEVSCDRARKVTLLLYEALVAICDLVALISQAA
jgi:hypothetical protein